MDQQYTELKLKAVLARRLPETPKEDIRPVEVRRFVRRGILNTYAALCASLESLCPSLSGALYSVYWKDECNDYVIVSSDVEVVHSVKQMMLRNDLCTWYVIARSGNSEVVHEGITCDSCNISPVTGDRFKCLQCEDFDLCRPCESSGAHKEHNMMKIVNPIPMVDLRHRIFSRPYIRFLKRQNSKSSTSDSSDDELNIESGCPMMAKRSNGKHHHKDKRERHGHKSKHSDKHRHHFDSNRQFMEQCARSTVKAAAQASRNLVGQACSVAADPRNVERLRNLGSTLRNSFGPSGAAAQPEAPTASANAVAPEEAIMTVIHEFLNAFNPGSAPAATSAAGDAPTASAATSGTPAPAPAATASTSEEPMVTDTPAQAPAPTTTVYPNLIDVESAVGKLSSLLAQQNIDPSPPEWTILTADGDEPGPSAPSPQQQAENDRFQKGLKILESMGFNNSSGIVTRVLRANDGDLYKTLEILLPMKK